MNRRIFLKCLGSPAAILGLSSLPLALPAFAMETSARPASIGEIPKACKVIGIGGAGGNIVEAIHRRAASERFALMPQFAYIDLGEPFSWRFDTNGVRIHGNTSAPLLSLDPLGAGSDVDYARVAALRNRDALQALLVDADVVCLVSGLGGATGSGVPPIVARLAREAGVLPVAVVVTPFGFENRERQAQVALSHLRRQTELVVTISNEEWIRRYGGETTIDEALRSIDHRVMEAVQRLVSWRPVVG